MLKKLKKLLGFSKEHKATVRKIRRLAVLAEIENQKKKIITKDKLQNFARKYGKDPRGIGGYFKGRKASLKKIDKNRYSLTEPGVKKVKQAQKELGNSWIEKLPITEICKSKKEDIIKF
ncbi:hypothetical protein JCM16358_02200 [Halanaerocella petrolearia]